MTWFGSFDAWLIFKVTWLISARCMGNVASKVTNPGTGKCRFLVHELRYFPPQICTSAAGKGHNSEMLFLLGSSLVQSQPQTENTFCLDLVQNSFIAQLPNFQRMQQEDYRITNRFIYCIYRLTMSEYTFVLCTLIWLRWSSFVVLDKPVISSFRILVTSKKTKNNSGRHNYARCYADQFMNSAFTSGAEPGVLLGERSFKLSVNTWKPLSHTAAPCRFTAAGSLQPSRPIPPSPWLNVPRLGSCLNRTGGFCFSLFS